MKTLSFGNYTGVVEDEQYAQDVFSITTQSGDLIEITRHTGNKLTITNGMNGYGENIFEEIKELEVKIEDGPFSATVGEPLHYDDNDDNNVLQDTYESESPADTLDSVEQSEGAFHDEAEDECVDPNFEQSPDGADINDHQD